MCYLVILVKFGESNEFGWKRSIRSFSVRVVGVPTLDIFIALVSAKNNGHYFNSKMCGSQVVNYYFL